MSLEFDFCSDNAREVFWPSPAHHLNVLVCRDRLLAQKREEQGFEDSRSHDSEEDEDEDEEEDVERCVAEIEAVGNVQMDAASQKDVQRSALTASSYASKRTVAPITQVGCSGIHALSCNSHLVDLLSPCESIS